MPIPYGGPNDPIQKWWDEWFSHLPEHVLQSVLSAVRSGQAVTVQGVLAKLAIGGNTHVLKRAVGDLLGIFGHHPDR